MPSLDQGKRRLCCERCWVSAGWCEICLRRFCLRIHGGFGSEGPVLSSEYQSLWKTWHHVDAVSFKTPFDLWSHSAQVCVLRTPKCSAKLSTHFYSVFTPTSFVLRFCFQGGVCILGFCWDIQIQNQKTGFMTLRKTFIRKNNLSPVTIDIGGTSQVSVAIVPFWLGNKLESEMDGPGKIGWRWGWGVPS